MGPLRQRPLQVPEAAPLPHTPQEASTRLLRFDRVQRGAHWANAALFGVLVMTALPLYVPAIERAVGRHSLVAAIHVWTGIAWVFPLVISLIGPWGTGMRRDLRRFNRWSREEIAWLWSFGAERGLEKDKFNPGQKLNALFVGGSIAVFLASGIVMQWFAFFPVSWRTGATFVHEVLAFLIVAAVAGHIVMAFTHSNALRSMVRGWVTIEWAIQHAPRWAHEELGEELVAVPGVTTTRGTGPLQE